MFSRNIPSKMLFEFQVSIIYGYFVICVEMQLYIEVCNNYEKL